MKVLFLVDNPYKALNPYTSTLIDGLKSIDCEIYIDWGILKLWEEKVFDFDIVHIMWPHLLLCRGKFSVKELFCRRDEIKKRQVKIVSTCHNIVPHYCDETNAVAAYNIVYSLSDIVLHLGNYSLHLFEKTYPNVKHLLLYHHIYDDRYKKTITKKTAIKKLHLDKNKRYILCFGAFRDREEQILIQNILNNINDDKIRIIAPQYCGIGKRSNILYILKFLYYKFKFPKIKMHFGAINDIDLPIYFAAADILLIQRIKILNSGNVPLGYYLKKVVVGPNIGNVGSILQETGNPVFESNSITSVINAIKKGIFLCDNNLGEKNYLFAIEHFSSNAICGKLYDCYKELIKE